MKSKVSSCLTMPGPVLSALGFDNGKGSLRGGGPCQLKRRMQGRIVICQACKVKFFYMHDSITPKSGLNSSRIRCHSDASSTDQLSYWLPAPEARAPPRVQRASAKGSTIALFVAHPYLEKGQPWSAGPAVASVLLSSMA